MAELWKTRQAGSIALTANCQTYTYYASTIEAEKLLTKKLA